MDNICIFIITLHQHDQTQVHGNIGLNVEKMKRVLHPNVREKKRKKERKRKETKQNKTKQINKRKLKYVMLLYA